MPYDGLVMHGVALECGRLLAGGRVDRIAQPNGNEIILHLRNHGANHKLLLSALADEARVHLTTTAPPNPAQPPVFCMVLRKHLEGGKVQSLEQQGLDRILHINFISADECGDLKPKRLIAEIMGKHSNLILVNPETGKIIDSLRRIPPSVSRYRQVLPGEPYQPPPTSNKLPLWDEREEVFVSRLMGAGMSKALDRLIMSVYDGLGPLSAQELIHRAGASPVDTLEYYGQGDYDRLYQVIATLGKELLDGIFHPEILYLENRPKDFSAIALTSYPLNRRQAFVSCNETLDTFFKDRDKANLFHQKQNSLDQIIRREQDRCQKKAGLQAEAMLEGNAAQKWQTYGRLLMAYHYRLHQVPEAVVPDFNDPEGDPVTIPMDPRLTPMENAQVYFHRYHKAKLTAEKAGFHHEETQHELSYLDSLALSLTMAPDLPGLAVIREELEEAGYVKSAGKAATRGAPPDQSAALGKLLIQGFTVLFGHNNRQNDYLNMKIAKPGDLWLHARNAPSAHVVVRNPDKKQIPRDVILAAAKICLWFSRSRASGKGEIVFTLRQNIWKPKGSKPGMMLYEQFQTLSVIVEEEEIRSLLSLQ